MKLSTKNIDKAIRTVKIIIAGLRVDDSIRCFKCGKKIRKNKVFSIINGLGGLNHYHLKCL
jgi:hypothetical protein